MRRVIIPLMLTLLGVALPALATEVDGAEITAGPMPDDAGSTGLFADGELIAGPFGNLAGFDAAPDGTILVADEQFGSILGVGGRFGRDENGLGLVESLLTDLPGVTALTAIVGGVRVDSALGPIVFDHATLRPHLLDGVVDPRGMVVGPDGVLVADGETDEVVLVPPAAGTGNSVTGRTAAAPQHVADVDDPMDLELVVRDGTVVLIVHGGDGAAATELELGPATGEPLAPADGPGDDGPGGSEVDAAEEGGEATMVTSDVAQAEVAGFVFALLVVVFGVQAWRQPARSGQRSRTGM